MKRNLLYSVGRDGNRVKFSLVYKERFRDLLRIEGVYTGETQKLNDYNWGIAILKLIQIYEKASYVLITVITPSEYFIQCKKVFLRGFF